MGIINKLKKYCDYYDVPINQIVNVISAPKVIPMIRGKAFEYTAADTLMIYLDSPSWKVENLDINAQPGTHDIDIFVTRLKDKKEIHVECKLAKNKSFKISKKQCLLNVKCMRSRTVSDNETAQRMAKNYGIPKELLLMHADNYREQDFDYVITTLGNAFWTTEDGKYKFNGTKEYFMALQKLFPKHFKNFKNFQKESYNFLLFARSKDLIVSPRNKLECKRRKCKSNNCGFIPNYPIINLNDVAAGKSPWKLIADIEKEFKSF